jgi:putative inorganic carbon (hco3(-)) transporter
VIRRVPRIVSGQRLLMSLWLILGCLAGLTIVSQPIPITITLFTLASFAVLGAITPWSALIVMLVLAPLRTLIATEAAIKVDSGQIAIAGLLTAWAIYRIARQKSVIQFVWSPVYIPVGVFVVTLGLTIFSATSYRAWLGEWLKWVQVLVLMTLALSLARDEQWQWLVFGLILAGAANAAIGLYEFFGGSGALHLLINNRNFRAFGTFGQPNPFGGFMGLLAPLALMTVLGYGGRLMRQWQIKQQLTLVLAFAVAFYIVATALIIVGIFISWSRGAWLGFAISMLVILLALPRKVWYGLAVLVAVVGVIAALWLSGRLPASISARITSSTEEFFMFDDVRGVDISPENYAVVERLAHWQAALNMIRHNPILGVGAGNYEVVYDEYRLQNWDEPLGHAHNYYLNIWAEAGIIGLASYGGLWLSVGWLTWRLRRHPDLLVRFTGVGLLGTWIYLAVHSLTDNLYVNNLFLHIGLMLGILAVLYNQTWLNIRMGGK